MSSGGNGERFTIRGGTGVDLELAIAGPGSRSYAFLIDWHIRVLVALAWIAGALLVVNGALLFRPAGGGRTGAALIILLPPLAFYLLYHPVIEVLMRGQTPGKRKAGVRIVTREGGVPGSGAILVRNVFRLIDSLPGFYVVGLAATFFSAQRVRIGDMAAGTLLVIDDTAAPQALAALTAGAGAARDLRSADLAAQILERWQELAADRRSGLARSLILRTGRAGDTERLARLTDADLRAELSAIARGTA